MKTLRQLRVASGQSQAALARALGVHKSTISLWESGKRTVTIPNARLLAGALGCPMSDVVAAVELSAQSRATA